jgi:hypothetical protein
VALQLSHCVCDCVCPLSCLQFCDVIRGYPLVPSPEIFGLHDNADITCQQAETYELLGTLLGLQPRSSSGGGGAANSQEVVVGRMAQDILDKVGSNRICTAVALMLVALALVRHGRRNGIGSPINCLLAANGVPVLCWVEHVKLS